MKAIINGKKYDTTGAITLPVMYHGIAVHSYFYTGTDYFKVIEKGDFKDLVALTLEEVREEFENFASVEDYERWVGEAAKVF